MADQQKPGSEQGRLKPQFEPSPEFAQAVDAAVQARIDAILPDLMARLPSPNGDGTNFAQALALQLAELTGQGTGRIYVAPEIVEARRAALEALKTALLEYRAQKIVPAYALTNKVVLNLGPRIGDVLVDPLYRDNSKIVQTTEIDWPGIPNMQMRPINAAAKRVHALFCDWIGRPAGEVQADDLLALTNSGAVVRGDAARVILASDARSRARNGMADSGDFGADPDAPAAGIRRHDPAPTQKVQVLGTLTAPVEVS